LKGNRYHVGDTLNISEVRNHLKHRIFLQALDRDRHVAWVGIEDNVNVNSSVPRVITAAKILYTVKPHALEPEPMAMVLVNYSLEHLYEHFSQVHLGDQAYMVVIDAQNRILYHPNKQLLGATITPALATLIGQHDGTFVQTIDDQLMLVSYARSQMSGWAVIDLVPMKTLMAPAVVIGRTTLLVLGLSFGVLLLAAVLVSAQVVQPIRQITHRFKLFQSGEEGWNRPLPVNGTDEIAELSHWFNAFLDNLSARQQAEVALAQAKEAAEAASLAKSRFLANISHELRTPLNAILGFTQVLAADPHTAPYQKESLAIINQSGEHLLNLINDVLDIAKIEAGKVTVEEQPVDFQALLTMLTGLFQPAARDKNLKLACELILPLPRYIQVDEGKLRQILTNLLSNAVKFTAAGEVTFRVSAVPQAAAQGERGGAAAVLAPELSAVDVPHLEPEKPVLPRWLIRFAVEDTGLGIAEAEQATLFEPFIQTSTGRQSQQGAGLGLSISARLAQIMSGEITVTSTVGQGSCFTLVLPAQEIEPVAIAPPPCPPAVELLAEDGPQRILIVDDAKPNRQILVKILGDLGFAVREAENGQEALTLWQQWAPHLVLMDLQMPVMDGYQATVAIRQAEDNYSTERSRCNGLAAPGMPAVPATVIIAVTAHVLEEERQQALSAGFDDFLSKPLRRSLLLEKIAAHLKVQYRYAEAIARS
ncbi:MAG TPA: response regulator, partial [Trichocoleus sp.]